MCTVALATPVEKKGADRVRGSPGFVVKAVTTWMQMLCLSSVELFSDMVVELADAIRLTRLPLQTVLRQAAP